MEWVLETNERIDALTERIDNGMATKEELEASISTLRDNVSNALGDIATQVQGLNDRIAELEGQTVTPEDVQGFKDEVDGIAQQIRDADPNPGN